MIVAAHQPHLFPWLGYFDKILRAEKFVLLDHVQYERRNYQNRAKILTSQGVQWVTVPVHQRSRDETILEKAIDNRPEGKMTWERKLLLSLHHSYARCAHYPLYEPGLRRILETPWESLAELDLALLRHFLDLLDIRTPIVRSSELPAEGRKSELVLNLCIAAGADTYLAGAGASRKYLDVEAFQKKGVGISWQEFQHPTYPQVFAKNGFVPGLSVVDLLFNCGPESKQIIRGKVAQEVR